MFHLQEDLLRGFEEEQLSMHTPTPIWKLRDKPPQDWNSPDSGGLRDEPPQDWNSLDSGGLRDEPPQDWNSPDSGGLRDEPPQDWNSLDSGGLNLDYGETPKADNQQQDR